MEVPRLWVQSELQLLAYTTVTATTNLSHICDLHHKLLQRQILNPLSGARDRTCILVDLSQILNPLSHNGTARVFCFGLVFRAAPALYGNSQARGPIGAANISPA